MRSKNNLGLRYVIFFEFSCTCSYVFTFVGIPFTDPLSININMASVSILCDELFYAITDTVINILLFFYSFHIDNY